MIVDSVCETFYRIPHNKSLNYKNQNKQIPSGNQNICYFFTNTLLTINILIVINYKQIYRF